MPEKKPHLNLVVIGHIDAGKSTLMGHILYATGSISDAEMRKIEAMAEQMEKGSFKYAFIMDRLKEERERGITIDLFYQKFTTPKYDFTIIDAPGHRDFVKNMITGASQADAALLVVSSRKGEFEAGISLGGQTREHAYLAKTLGVNQLVVAVNKMDDPSTNWSQERYNQVKQAVIDLLKPLYPNADKEILFVPVSAWTGDNLTKPSPKMAWYKGPTLIEAFDTLKLPEKPVNLPLRIPIETAFTITGVGTVPCGRVETGVLKVGDKVIFQPAGKTGDVKTIEMHHERLEKAEPGDNIGFNVRGIAKGDVKRGDVCGHVETPPTVVQEFKARVLVLNHPTAIAAGYTPVIHAHTAQVACKFEELISKFDPKTGAVIQEKPDFVKKGEGVIVRMIPIRPLVIERLRDIPQLGRFAVRDMGTTVAVGMVEELVPKK
ncbi:MAG: translation elongation factor EF-1 subunit alpha [Candidatus Odinarchaeota archaeon]